MFSPGRLRTRRAEPGVKPTGLIWRQRKQRASAEDPAAKSSRKSLHLHPLVPGCASFLPPLRSDELRGSGDGDGPIAWS